MSAVGGLPRAVVGLGLALVATAAFGLWVHQAMLFRGAIALAVVQALLHAAAVAALLRWRPDGGTAGPGIGRGAILVVVGVALTMRLLAVPVPVLLSTDVYRYVWDGRVQNAGINPYVYIPADESLAGLRDERIYPLINRADYAPTIYPPAAQLVFRAVAALAETVTAMKLAMLAFEALAMLAIWRLLRRHGREPACLLIYAWHPLPVWEFAGNAHLDAVAIAFTWAALWAGDRRQRTAEPIAAGRPPLARKPWSPFVTGALLAAGTLTKYVPIVVSPALWRPWDWRLLGSFAVTLVLLALPFLGAGWALLGFLPGYAQEEGLASGAGFWPLQLLELVGALPGWAGAAYAGLAAATLLGLALWLAFVRRAAPPDLWGACVLAMAFTLAATPHRTWYFAFLLPFAAFHFTWPLLWLTGASLLLYLLEWPPMVVTNTILYLPFLILLGWEMRRRRPALAGTIDHGGV